MAPRKWSNLPQVLVEEGLVTDEQLAAARIIARDESASLAVTLVSQGTLNEVKLASVLCSHFGFELVRPLTLQIDKELLSIIPDNFARSYEVLPVSTEEDILTLAVVDPFQLVVFDELRKMVGLDIQTVVSVRSELLQAIDTNYASSLGSLPPRMDEGSQGIEEVALRHDVEDVTTHEADTEPVVKSVRWILRRSMELGASDIHIEPFEKSISLRYRVDGALRDEQAPPKRYQAQITARLKILCECRVDERRLPQDGRLRVRFDGRDVDFRVGFLPCRYGEKVVLRILDQGAVPLDISKMGFEPQPQQAFADALAAPNGMLLVTGPTGSGKTTTLYSALTALNTRERNIVTIEDPIEYEVFGINQVQTNKAIGLTFSEALRQILRQDPDVVMIGEIRDEETASIASKAALTGHLVLSTLHTNDAAAVYPRLIDMGLEPYIVQSSVILASAQRLLRKVCPKCCRPARLSPEALKEAQYTPSASMPEPLFVEAVGCAECGSTGYKGRVPVLEAVPNLPELTDLVLQRASASQIKRMAMACGVRSLRQNALVKAAHGITTLKEVIERTAPDRF